MTNRPMLRQLDLACLDSVSGGEIDIEPAPGVFPGPSYNEGDIIPNDSQPEDWYGSDNGIMQNAPGPQGDYGGGANGDSIDAQDYAQGVMDSMSDGGSSDGGVDI